MLLKDKVVIVSGIGPGLGTELALEAARQGAKLAIAGRTLKKLDAAASAVADLGLVSELIRVQTDITDPVHCQQLVEQTIKTYGRIDCLINSAFNPGGADLLEQANLAAWRSAMEVNLFGTMNLTLAALPQMKAQRAGSIVNVNTMVTRKPMPTQAGYAASKAALAAATQHLALELGQHGIRVNSTYMGWM
ncbi:MAG TPA: SDR family NAD(P)-dependent oxidoreductase, partial [Pseudomonadales bacterium]|nr:SDR family NAD(P)-dependent oxidoreductase [Pseudomonadales bacterium]